MDSTGNRIKKIRVSLDYSQEQFGDIFKRTKMTVSKWENNKSEPEFEVLAKIANLGNVTLDWLLLGEETDKENQSNIIIGLRERIKEMGKEISDQKVFINMVAEKAPKYLSNKKGRKK